MSQPTTKSSLSEAQRRLVALLQWMNFGRVEHLRVRRGEPLFDPPPRVIRTLKMGADNSRRRETSFEDFWLKRQTIEMLQVIADLSEGEVLAIEVQHGLAFALEVEFRHETSTGAQGHA
jgi:hypothetical protein